MRYAFKRLGATGVELIHVFAQQAPAGLLAELHERARIERPALIVVDTLQRLIRTKDINDYAAVTTAFEPLLALARDTGSALLLLHHASAHATRDGLDAVLGSTALSGSVDNVLVLQRTTSKRRVLSSTQRIGPDLDAVVIDLDPAGQLRIAGRQVDINAEEIAAAMLDALRTQPDGLTERELRTHVEGRLRDQARALRVLLGARRVTRSGAGKKGNPYVYCCAELAPGGPDAGSRSGSHDENGRDHREPELSGAAKDVRFDFSDSGSLVPYIQKNNGNQKVPPCTDQIPTSSVTSPTVEDDDDAADF